MPPRPLDDPRRLVKVGTERAYDVANTEFPGNFPGEDHSWSLKKFKKDLKVDIQRLSRRSIEFDLVGVDASIANAFRRILIAEVPTIAIEHVYVWNNTSVIHDEVLAQRLGLVPIDVDPALMEFHDGVATDRNTLVFRLQVACERRKGAARDEVDPEKLYKDSNVLSKHFTWIPQGEQGTIFADHPPKPTNENILLAKLRPGQELDIEVHAIKGRGNEHAKWSPVGTASYRLLPLIQIHKPIPPELADKFRDSFSPGVITVDPRTKHVTVTDSRRETMSREVLRHPEFEGYVSLARVRDFFLFKIETESAYPPERLFTESISVFREKVKRIKVAAQKLVVDTAHDADAPMDTT